MTRVNDRIKELSYGRIRPRRKFSWLGGDYGMGNDFKRDLLEDGMELTAINPNRGLLRSNKGLYDWILYQYLTWRGDGIPSMLEFMRPRITEDEMNRLLEPLPVGMNFRQVKVGKGWIREFRGEDSMVSYSLTFQFHRLIKASALHDFSGFTFHHDILLPAQSYYSKDGQGGH